MQFAVSRHADQNFCRVSESMQMEMIYIQNAMNRRVCGGLGMAYGHYKFQVLGFSGSPRIGRTRACAHQRIARIPRKSDRMTKHLSIGSIPIEWQILTLWWISMCSSIKWFVIRLSISQRSFPCRVDQITLDIRPNIRVKFSCLHTFPLHTETFAFAAVRLHLISLCESVCVCVCISMWQKSVESYKHESVGKWSANKISLLLSHTHENWVCPHKTHTKHTHKHTRGRARMYTTQRRPNNGSQ